MDVRINKPAVSNGMKRDDDDAVEWTSAKTAVVYPDAEANMQARAEAIRAGDASEQVWLVEHPPLYTAGTSARPEDLLEADRFPVFKTGRGGQYTYHGPGQRVAYVMLDLNRRKPDVRRFVTTLEDWLVDTLAAFGVAAGRSPGNIGIWVPRPEKGPGREDKIAAIGIRIRRWVTFHGISLNVDPDLTHFAGIVPCGVTDQGVTSLAELGVKATMADVDAALKESFETHFGPAIVTPSAGP